MNKTLRIASLQTRKQDTESTIAILQTKLAAAKTEGDVLEALQIANQIDEAHAVVKEIAKEIGSISIE